MLIEGRGSCAGLLALRVDKLVIRIGRLNPLGALWQIPLHVVVEVNQRSLLSTPRRGQQFLNLSRARVR